MASSNKFSVLSTIAHGLQNDIDYEKMINIKTDGVYSKIETKDIYDNNYMKKLEIVDKRNVYFNCLELKFFNPKRKPFNEVFERISFENQKEKIISFDNEEFLKILQTFTDLKQIRHEHDYTIIPLPFLLNDNIMYNTEWNRLYIKLQMKSFISNPELYGTVYERTHPINKNNLRRIKAVEKNTGGKIENNEIYEVINNRIIQLQSFKEIIDDNMPETKIKLNFAHLTNMIYFIGDMAKIICIEFEITNIVNEIFDVDKLIETNKKNGYDFDFPVIILDPTFFKNNSGALNMSRIDEVKIRICHTGLTELLIYNVNINTLKIENGYNALGFIH